MSGVCRTCTEMAEPGVAINEARLLGRDLPKLEEILESKKVGDVVVSQQQVVVLPEDSTIEQAFKVLATAKVLSAPVYDAERREYVGLVDMFDLLKEVLRACSQDREVQTATQTVHLQSWCTDAATLMRKGKEVAHQPISIVMDSSEENPICTVSLNTPLPELLVGFQRGVHRAIVIDDTQKLQRIVSQSDVIRFVSEYIEYYGPLGQTQLQEVGLGQHPVITVNQKARAVNAFHILQENKVSAVAVVDDSGVLVANLSISDLRGLDLDRLGDLMLSIPAFLLKTRKQSLLPPIICRPHTTFETVVLKLASTRVHRIWNVDEAGRPIGVVSLTDVIKLLDLRVYVKQEERELAKEKSIYAQ